MTDISTTANPSTAGRCPRCGGQLYAGMTHGCTTSAQVSASVASPKEPRTFADPERVIETARRMVTAFDGMRVESFWVEYGALKSEIEEFERTWWK